MSASRCWSLVSGDIDATIAQVGYNLAQLVIPVFLLAFVGISREFSAAAFAATGICVGIPDLAQWPRRLGRALVPA